MIVGSHIREIFSVCVVANRGIQPTLFSSSSHATGASFSEGWSVVISTSFWHLIQFFPLCHAMAWHHTENCSGKNTIKQWMIKLKRTWDKMMDLTSEIIMNNSMKTNYGQYLLWFDWNLMFKSLCAEKKFTDSRMLHAPEASNYDKGPKENSIYNKHIHCV
jgi:hypothetical protein